MTEQTRKVHVIGGGTVSHVRPHFALCAPAYGRTAHHIHALSKEVWGDNASYIHLTKMAAGGLGNLETNDDIAKLLHSLVEDPATAIIFLTAALCDFNGSILDGAMPTESGKTSPRLRTAEGVQQMTLTPSDKIIGSIRKYRKDLFLVGFKTTSGATEDDQYLAGLELLKKASCNLVLANDIKTRIGMIVTPEQARYSVTEDRGALLEELVAMTKARSQLKFTRSTVISGNLIPWSSDDVPQSLRTVVNHCITRGAYKPFLGSTVGHFAVKAGDDRFLTSIRKTNFNNLSESGLVLVTAEGDDNVVAHGAKPSVGGQSQRIVFKEHPETDCIVHAHVPLRLDHPDDVPVRSQREYECGSHECGQNTSSGLKKFGNLWAVMLDKHGPNVVFNKATDPTEVISFIERNFDLEGRTDDLKAA